MALLWDDMNLLINLKDFMGKREQNKANFNRITVLCTYN